jgi:uncharacterized protein YgbK (DUF1537 family)
LDCWAADEQMAICPMIDDTSAWAGKVVSALRDAGSALMLIDRPLDRAPGAPQRLQSALADAVAAVLSEFRPDHMLLEGGATAAAVCRRMDWRAFAVVAELAGGVVQLRVDGSLAAPSLIIKPGSYAWPAVVWR